MSSILTNPQRSRRFYKVTEHAAELTTDKPEWTQRKLRSRAFECVQFEIGYSREILRNHKDCRYLFAGVRNSDSDTYRANIAICSKTRLHPRQRPNRQSLTKSKRSRRCGEGRTSGYPAPQTATSTTRRKSICQPCPRKMQKNQQRSFVGEFWCRVEQMA